MRRFSDIRLQKCRDLEIWVRGHQRSVKWYHAIDWVWFPISVPYNIVPKTDSWDIQLILSWDSQHVTMKSGLWLLKVIGTDTDRSDTYDFLLTFCCRKYGAISYDFRDKRRFQSKIVKLPRRMRGTTWPVSGGCKIITYLESLTPVSY